MRATARESARCSRRSTLSRNSSVSASSQSRSTTPESLEWPTSFGEHGEHGAVVAQHFSSESLDTVAARDRCQVLEEQGGDPGALMGIAHHERSFGLVATRPSFVARPRNELVVRFDGQCGPVDHVDVGEVQEFLLAQLWLG